MYQHEETGLIGFVHAQQLERNWQKMNPRLVITGPVFTSPPAPVAAIKPVVWRIPVNGDWFYGTKDQCTRERAEYESTFTAEDFEDAGTVEPEPLACLDKVKEMNQ